jgi:hypothetical protein
LLAQNFPDFPMIHEFTTQQLADLTVDAQRPLVICDVDDVVVHFLRGFDAMLARTNHVLEANSFALNGNVLHRETRSEMPHEDVSKLVDDFFFEQTEHMEAIDGAVASLNALSKHASIVIPVITNSGPKGPAIKNLEGRTRGPVVFVDDSPNFVQSSYEHAPQVKIVHFLHDERFAKLHTPFDFVSHTTGNWHDAKQHIEGLITG